MLALRVHNAAPIDVGAGVNRIDQQAVQGWPIGTVPLEVSLVLTALGANRHPDAVDGEVAQDLADRTVPLIQIEGQADDLHDIGLQELYRANQPSNSMAFFVGVEVYDHLEKVVDRFDDVANEIHGIMLENV